MNSKEAGIYSITSRINGKRYIGSAIRISTRWSHHKSDLKNNRHTSNHLQNHYNKYGEEDLIFSIIEIVEKGDLTLQEFKKLLLEREQVYLNNWNECQFNCVKIAGSSLGHKIEGSKYYVYNKKQNSYVTQYSVNGILKYFSYHILEEDAKSEVEYIKTLDEEQLTEYLNICRNKPRSKKRNSKNYTFNKKDNAWTIQFRIKGKLKYFGCFYTEQEAISQIEYINKLDEEQKLEYCKTYLNKPRSKRNRNSKYYTFCKVKNRWIVNFFINKKINRFGYFKTEQEAINKVNEVKIELGICNN